MTDADYLWKPESRTCQVRPWRWPATPLCMPAAPWMVRRPGKYFLRVLSLADGTKLSEIAWTAPHLRWPGGGGW